MSDNIDCCAKCGYLGLRSRDTRELVEADERYRTTGEVPALVNYGSGVIITSSELIESTPICAVSAADLANEMETCDDWHEVVTNVRDCRESTKWRPGFTPQQHVQMNMLEQQRQWQREMAEFEHRWREEQAARDRQWRKDDAEDLKDKHRDTLLIALVAAFIGGALACIATFVAAIAGN